MTWLPVYYPPAQDAANRYEAHCSGVIRNAKTHRELKPFRRKEDGYCSVTLYIDGRKTFAYVHKIMAYTFLGDPEGDRNKVDHLDRRPWNNNADNLRWASSHEQAANRAMTQPLVLDPARAGTIRALEWARVTSQISGETLREEILVQNDNK